MTDHYLVNREIERNILLKDAYKAFYVQGVSACGKTQLIKNIMYLYNQKGKKIFWHTVRTDESEQQINSFYTALAHFFNTIKVDISPYPYVIPATSSRGEKYVRSEANDTPDDNLLKLPRV